MGPVFAPDYERLPSNVKMSYDGQFHKICANLFLLMHSLECKQFLLHIFILFCHQS